MCLSFARRLIASAAGAAAASPGRRHRRWCCCCCCCPGLTAPARRPAPPRPARPLWQEETTAYPFRPDRRFVDHKLGWVRALVAGLPEMASQAKADHAVEPYPDCDISAYIAAKEHRAKHGIGSLWDQLGRAAPDQSRL